MPTLNTDDLKMKQNFEVSKQNYVTWMFVPTHGFSIFSQDQHFKYPFRVKKFSVRYTLGAAKYSWPNLFQIDF